MKFNISFITFLLTLSFSYSSPSHRRIVHQPLFLATSSPPPPPSPPTNSDNPFFHENGNTSYRPPPPPPPATAAGVAGNTTVTHPIAPQPANKPAKKIAVVISVGIVTLGMLSALAFFIYKHKSKQQSESRKLVGENSLRNVSYEESPRNLTPSTFLYIGTVEPSRTATESTNGGGSNGSPYNKLNPIKRSERYRPSPELQPLPPLSKPQPPPPAAGSSSDEEDEIHDFYTPQGSIASTDDGYSVRSLNTKRINRWNSSPNPHSKRTSPRSRLSVSSSPDTAPENLLPANSPARRAKFAAPPPGPDMTRLHNQKPKIPIPPQPPPPPLTRPEKLGGFPLKATSTSSKQNLPKLEAMSPGAKVIPKIVKTMSFQDVNNDDDHVRN